MHYIQQEQARQFLNNWLSDPRAMTACLQGYAGTGKTWLAADWAKQVLAANPKINIMILAPTNKALDVLREKCGHLNAGFRTIDSFLGNRIKRNDDGEMERSQGKGSENPDLIICDEASMVKAEYDTQLRGRRVKLLYLGDPAQLPPINEKLSTTFNCEYTFLMTQVVRYEGAIIKVATFLRDCYESGRSFVLSDLTVFKDEARTLSVIKMGDLHNWALQAVRKGMDSRIVAFTNAAVNEHNAIMHHALFPDAALFGVSEKVVVNETFELPTIDPDSEQTDMLYNGEMLTVVSCVENPILECGVRTFAVGVLRGEGRTLEVNGVPQRVEYVLDVALDADHAAATHKNLTNGVWEARKAGNNAEVKRLIDLRKPLNKLAPLRHSYSCTTHKSQGSTYDIAFVDWANIFRSNDRTQMMYVGATRPSKFLVLAVK